MNNAVFGKTMESMRKHRDINLVKTERRKTIIRTKLSYYKFFYRNLLAIEMKKSEILMKKPICLGLSILELSIGV